MATRPYDNTVRSAAADAKRAHVIEIAAEFLRHEPLTAFSLDAVARGAGVTRLTLYNQFAARAGLLEAVLDHLADSGRLGRLQVAVADPSPRHGLDNLVEIFCDFWNGDLAVGRLHDASATDPEFAKALDDRNERRRHTIAALLERPPLDAAASGRRAETLDLLFALTSYAMFRLLRDGPSGLDPRQAIQAACRDALARMEDEASP